jgi:AraC-like DNA-binding protein
MFKKNSGMTLRAYCNKLKLEEGERLIRNTDMSVTRIAMDVGFNDVSHFINLFRKKYGVSPLLYRKTLTISDV